MPHAVKDIGYFYNAIEHDERKVNLHISYSGYDYIIDSSCIPLNSLSLNNGITLTEAISDGTDYVVGNTMMAQVEMTFVKDAIPAAMNLNKSFYLFGVLDYPDGEQYPMNYVFIGKFYPKKITDNKNGYISVTAYDDMHKFDRPAEDFMKDSSLNAYKSKYGVSDITPASLFQWLCDYLEITVANDIVWTSIGNRVLDAKIIDNLRELSCRNILSYIAEANGMYVRMKTEYDVSPNMFAVSLTMEMPPNLNFIYGATDVNVVFSSDLSKIYDAFNWLFDEYYWVWREWEEFVWEEIEGTQAAYGVKYVKYLKEEDGNVETNNYPLAIGAEYLDVTDNPLLRVYEDADMQYIQAIYNLMITFGGVCPSEQAVGRGCWCISAGDAVRVGGFDGTRYPVFHMTATWRGGMTQESYET